MIDFAGQFVVVTGATGNLGSAVALAMARLGATLALAGTRQAELDQLAERIGGGGHLLMAGADIRTREGAQRVAAGAIAAFGRIDALVNTVGTFKTADVVDGASRDWQAMMDLNALSVLLICEAVLPHMRERGYGRIVNVGAGAGQKASAGASIYAASKAAVLRITEAVSEENKARGVTANCILPGTIDTPQNRAAMPNADPGSWVRSDEVAAVVAFLASRAASGVTGAAIPVAGKQ